MERESWITIKLSNTGYMYRYLIDFVVLSAKYTLKKKLQIRLVLNVFKITTEVIST